MTDERKPWYGPGRQPIDDIEDAGWGPHFAAANVLKYLRRSFWAQNTVRSGGAWHLAFEKLNDMLTEEEMGRLQ